jgi:ElaB/YqjD/DUF883 family membrane-anchored ribosome-binding protein
MNVEGDVVTSDKLLADLRVVAADVEELLKATASQAGQHVAQARARVTESLKAYTARAAELQEAALAKTRAAGRATDVYVRANPWQAVAICAVAGLLLGALLARSGTSDS